MTIHQHKKVLLAISVFLIAFVATFFASSVFAPSDTTNADSLFFTFEGTDYTISINSADTIELELYTTPSGTVGITSDAITTITNNPEGYKLYLAMNQSSDYDSAHPGNALYQDGNSTSSYFISPTTGTISEPAILSTNTWGFALIGGVNKEVGVPDAFSSFDPVYVDSNGNSSTGETGKVLDPNSKFAAVPLHPDAVLVQESSTATNNSGNTLKVYYGVNGTMALPSGSYIGTISYFVLSDSSASLVDGISVFPTTINTAGEEISIATSLHTNYNFTDSDIVVTLTDIADNTNTGTCAISSTSTDTGSLIINCNTPELVAGNYTVNVSIPMYGKSWNAEVTLEEKTTSTPSGTDFWSISTMQEMTSTICSSVYTPSNDVGENINIVTLAADNAGTISGAKETFAIKNMKQYQELVTADGQPYVAQRTLSDIRDGKSYTVRKLADGKCWITENLKTKLTSGIQIIAAYSDGGTFDYTPSTTPGLSSTGDYYLYDYATATAGQGEGGSICPENWHIPLNGEFNNLVKTLYPQYTQVPTDFISGQAVWSSTSGNAFTTDAYYVSSQKANYYCGGKSVWCPTYISNSSAYAARCVSNSL